MVPAWAEPIFSSKATGPVAVYAAMTTSLIRVVPVRSSEYKAKGSPQLADATAPPRPELDLIAETDHTSHPVELLLRVVPCGGVWINAACLEGTGEFASCGQV